MTAPVKKVSLGDRVTAQLRDDIVSGVYLPGERVTELRLSADYGVSRVPVREALRTMESEGFVLVTSHTERVVASISDDEALDLYAVREAVETRAAQRAATRADPAGRESLLALLERGAELLAVDDAHGLGELNTVLHHEIVAASGSALLVSMFGQLEAKNRWFNATRPDTRQAESWAEHARIVEAIVRGDSDGAAALVREHLEVLTEQVAGTP